MRRMPAMLQFIIDSFSILKLAEKCLRKIPLFISNMVPATANTTAISSVIMLALRNLVNEFVNEIQNLCISFFIMVFNLTIIVPHGCGQRY